MLISGAEIARIEGTIHYILGCCHDRNAQTMVFSTGIFVSLDSPEGERADPGSESGGALYQPEPGYTV